MRLMVALTAVFLALFVSDDLMGMHLREWLIFEPNAVLRQPWSVVTFPFVHLRVFELLFNLLTLYFFAGTLEERWGGQGFLRFCAVSAAGALLLATLLDQIGPARMPGASVAWGFQGAIYGMLLAFAMEWPDMEINLFGILPIKARWLVLASAIIGFVASVQNGGLGLAHLGAFGTAFLYLKSPWAPRAWGEVPPARKTSRRPQSSKAVVPWAARKEQAAAPQPAQRPAAAAGARRGVRAERDLLDDVDRILDKISAQGLSSLTEEERKRLDEVSRRYRTN
ncbi:MAG TPA: rhomboid family intramembrane serine protease [Longimicrobium sp.]|nr:rhomboid family intramembrane serine protease [Longimicrobium sp.]